MAQHDIHSVVKELDPRRIGTSGELDADEVEFASLDLLRDPNPMLGIIRVEQLRSWVRSHLIETKLSSLEVELDRQRIRWAVNILRTNANKRHCLQELLTRMDENEQGSMDA